ncbi:MAG: glycine cleavage system protein H [Planctomycetota bacterium]
MTTSEAFLPFERAKFRTRLPRGHYYTAGHMWLRASELDGEAAVWHVGLTRFALRMLGEPVDLDFEAKVGDPIEKGQVVGWFEGFKAVTDLFAPMQATFAGANPALAAGLDAVHRSSYDRGWLFALRGPLDRDCIDAEGYAAFLEAAIDKVLGDSHVEGDPRSHTQASESK